MSVTDLKINKMKKQKLFLEIFPPFLFLFVAIIVLVVWWLGQSFHKFHINQKREALVTYINLLKNDIDNQSVFFKGENLNKFCKDSAKTSKCRITILTHEGKVLVDSHEDPSRMGDHRQRPEILDALNKESGVSIR